MNDVAAQLRETDKVYIDGVNNLAHWTIDAPTARNIVYFYNEADCECDSDRSLEVSHADTQRFFDYNKPAALIFNLRMGPV